MRSLFLALGFAGLAAAANPCGPNDIQGTYGMQLSGVTTVGVDGPQPVAAIGRLVFDENGGVNGVSSIGIAGYFVGSPVNGKYSFKADCSLTFDLRDQSGGFQHFAGVAKDNATRVDIRQTDAQAGADGVLLRTASGCQTASLHGAYAFNLAGTASEFADGRERGTPLSVKGTVTSDGAGNLELTWTGGHTTGTYEVDSDCIAEIELGVTQGDSADIVKLRGVLVNQGRLLLAVESDPAGVAIARLIAKE